MARQKTDKQIARLSLAIDADIKTALDKCAALDGVSVNSVAENVLRGYTDSRAEEISEYNRAVEKIRNKKHNSVDL